MFVKFFFVGCRKIELCVRRHHIYDVQHIQKVHANEFNLIEINFELISIHKFQIVAMLCRTV